MQSDSTTLNIAVSALVGASTTSNGDALVIECQSGNSTKLHLSFPFDAILELIRTAVWARTNCRIHQNSNPDKDIDVIATKEFRIGLDKRSGQNVILLTTQEGGKMAWALDSKMLIEMKVQLDRLLSPGRVSN